MHSSVEAVSIGFFLTVAEIGERVVPGKGSAVGPSRGVRGGVLRAGVARGGGAGESCQGRRAWQDECRFHNRNPQSHMALNRDGLLSYVWVVNTLRPRRPSTSEATSRALTCQGQPTCRQLTRPEGLPFASHLPAQQVHDACRSLGTRFRDRLFSPALTLWTFLSQCLDADHSCRQAVTRLLAWRTAAGRPRCSTNTGAYCKARRRLPEAVLTRLTRDTGAAVLGGAAQPWLWKGRVVKVADGTGVSMPDTPANQAEYPQPCSQKPGCGFPLLRLVVVFSLAVGTVLDAALGRYHGPGTGEQSLFRSLWEGFAGGDVLLGDRNFCSYWVVAGARSRGVDVVLRLNASWAKGLRACQRLGPGERRMWLRKPASGVADQGGLCGGCGGVVDSLRRGARAPEGLPDEGPGGGDDARGPGG
jgi:hypothetical protein